MVANWEFAWPWLLGLEVGGKQVLAVCVCHLALSHFKCGCTRVRLSSSLHLLKSRPGQVPVLLHAKHFQNVTFKVPSTWGGLTRCGGKQKSKKGGANPKDPEA